MRKPALFAVLFAAVVLSLTQAPVRTAAQEPSHQVYLPLVMRYGSLSLSLPTSDQLIDAALANGAIDSETALIYKVFAAFSDSRLPVQFQGDDHLLPDSHIVAQVQSQYGALTDATRTILNPFLIPPVYLGSWVEPNGAAAAGGPDEVVPLPCSTLSQDWTYKDGADVRVWWHKNRPADETAADGYIAAMEGTIWPKLVGLLGRQPKSDAAIQCNGGSGPDDPSAGKMDIFLEPKVARSMAPANNDPGCRKTSAYIVLNPTVSDGILAHEFMHVLQWGYETRDSCMYPGEYAWLAEATASWAQDYTYPTTNEEHYLVDWFFLDSSLPPLEFKNDAHEYGTYIFFLYLTRKEGDNDVVQRAWALTESNDSLEAVNEAISGGFEAVWSDFANHNWNASPYDYYRQWDGQTARAKAYLGKDQISGPGLWPMTSTVPHLGLLYKHYTFSGESARLITFLNGLTYKLGQEGIDEQVGVTTVADGSQVFTFTDLTEPPPGVKVQALFRIEGDDGWQLEDWTGRPHVSFCRDAASERLAELVIIMSNSEYFPRTDSAAPEGLPSQLQVSDMGCWKFTGSATARMWGTGEGGTYDDSQTVQNAVFERLPNEVHPDIPYPYLSFWVTGGNWRREFSIVTVDGCTANVTHQWALGSGYGLDYLWTLPGVISGNSKGRYLGYANTDDPLVYVAQCPDGSSGPSPYPVMSDTWFNPSVLGEVLEKTYTVGALGELKGDDKYPIADEDAEVRYTWDLMPQRE